MMKTIGSILRDTRIHEGLTLEDIAKRTKIRKNFLQALEENNFSSLPSEPVARGFIQIYARELGYDQKSAIALFRRDFASTDSGEIVPHAMVSPINTKKTAFQKMKWAVIACITALIFFLGVWTYYTTTINAVPNVTISEPKEGQRSKSPIAVIGKTATDAVVKINGKNVALNQDGVFQSSVEFDVGEHTVTVEVISRSGKSKLVQRTVNVVE